MSASRRWALVGARAMTGIVGLAAAVAMVGAATLLPWPSQRAEPGVSEVAPAASEQQRVCPGPLLALAADASDASAASSIGAAGTVYAARRGGGVGPGPVAESVLDVPDNTAGAAAGAPLLLGVAAAEPPLPLAGSQSQTATTETVSGFAAASCSEAESEAWLVAGSTVVGQTSLVLLSNPSAVAASVDLALYGEAGPVDAPGSTGIVVPPISQRVVALAGLAPELNSPIVRVTSRGGQVVASLQQSVIRGLVPGGIELVGSTARPAQNQVIGGFIVPAAVHDETQSNDSHFHDSDAAVRVLNLGDTPSSVSVSVTAEGDGAGTSIEVTLQPGIASEVPLSELAAGSYTVRLSSEQPIVAAARSTETSDAGEDFAWFVAARPLAGESVLAVADGPSAVLTLTNTASAAQTVSLAQGEGGPAVDIEVPAGGARSQVVGAGASYLLDGMQADSVLATVSYQGSGALSSFALNPPGPLAQPIAVYTR